MPDGALGFEGERGEIIPFYDELFYLSIISLKKFYLLKIIVSIINFYLKKIFNSKILNKWKILNKIVDHFTCAS